MYRSLLLVVLVFAQSYNLRKCFAAPTLENEIHHDKAAEVKSFREKYASHMKSFMNISVNPCDDFYEFACGNFPKTLEYIDTSEKRSNLMDIKYINNELIGITLQKHRSPDEQYAEEMEKARQLYNSCLNENLWPLERKEELLEVLKSFGGFPAVDPTWNASSFDWFKMSAHLSRYGVVGMVKEEVFLMYPFPPYYELPKFGFNFDVYLENIATKESPGYVANCKKMRQLLNAYGVFGSKADDVIEDIMAFLKEAQTAKENPDLGELCKFFLVNGTQYKFPRWNSFFEVAWDVEEFSISENSDCPCDWYYKELDAIISRHPQAAANYMALKFIFELYPHPETKSSKFQRTHCLSYMRNSMPLLLSHFYMQDHYDKSSEIAINEIISEVKLSVKKLVETADWLDEPTRLEALNKLHKLRTRLAEADDPLVDVYIQKIKQLNITDNFAENILTMRKFVVDLSHYGYLHSNISETSLPVTLLDAIAVNAFYYVVENSINVLAGILHIPVYHRYLPKSANYGTLGYIIGHELTHSFDSVGGSFDSDLNINYWWSEKSAVEFDNRLKCFANHYSQYVVPELLEKKINGTGAQDETIADSSGLREALNAYRKVYKSAVKNKVENFEANESLPGLGMNPDQTFFLSFAQLYCSHYSMENYWVELADDHPLDKYRVLSSLQNFEEFSNVFNCPLGSFMNPKEKCRFW